MVCNLTTFGIDRQNRNYTNFTSLKIDDLHHAGCDFYDQFLADFEIKVLKVAFHFLSLSFYVGIKNNNWADYSISCFTTQNSAYFFVEPKYTDVDTKIDNYPVVLIATYLRPYFNFTKICNSTIKEDCGKHGEYHDGAVCWIHTGLVTCAFASTASNATNEALRVFHNKTGAAADECFFHVKQCE